jgi:hypothetical protein
VAAAAAAGEQLWRLPLSKGLTKKLDSPIADMKNYAGALAACSLEAMKQSVLARSCSSSSSSRQTALKQQQSERAALQFKMDLSGSLRPWLLFPPVCAQAAGVATSLLRCSCRLLCRRALPGPTWMLRGLPGTMMQACPQALGQQR